MLKLRNGFMNQERFLKEKTVQEQKEFGAGKRKIGRTGEILRDSPTPDPTGVRDNRRKKN
jgi:hypothetical protein